MAKKRILVVSEKKLNTEFVSGIELRLLQMADYFRELGLEVGVISPDSRFFPWKAFLLANFYDFIYLMQASSSKSVVYRLTGLPIRAKIILDLYTPLLLEKSVYAGTPRKLSEIEQRLQRIIAKADFYLCANPRQKKYYRLENMAIVPFLPARTEVAGAKKHSGFNLVWLGAFYPWFSGEELIRALADLERNITLTIIGGKNPKTNTFDAAFEKIVALAEQLKVRYRVKMIPWLSYEELFKVLANGDLGICLTGNSPEDKLAIRSRMITLLQANLPLVVNGRDEISDLVAKLSLGIRLKTNTAREIKQAIEILRKQKRQDNIWEKAKREMESWRDDLNLQEYLG